MQLAITFNNAAGPFDGSAAASAPGADLGGLPFAAFLDAQTTNVPTGIPPVADLFGLIVPGTDPTSLPPADERGADFDKVDDFLDGRGLVTVLAASLPPIDLSKIAAPLVDASLATARDTQAPVNEAVAAGDPSLSLPVDVQAEMPTDIPTLLTEPDAPIPTVNTALPTSTPTIASPKPESSQSRLPIAQGPLAIAKATPTDDIYSQRLRLAGGYKPLAEKILRASLAEDRPAQLETISAALTSIKSDASPTATPAAVDAPAAEFMKPADMPQVDMPAARTFTRPSPAVQTSAVTNVDVLHLSKDGGAPSNADSGTRQQSSTTTGDPAALLLTRSIYALQSGINFESALQTEVATQTVTIPNEANVATSIVQSMRMQMKDGIGTAVVNLEPNYLGHVTIALKVEGGQVTATLHAENPQVRAWMEANEPMLRQGLSEQGLTLDRLLVSEERLSEEQSRSDARRQSQDQEQPRHKPRRDETSTFEVVV